MRVFLGSTFCVGIVLLVVTVVPIAVAADVTAVVTEKGDRTGVLNTVKLNIVTTASLMFQVGEAEMNIPVTKIRRIEALGRGDFFKITLVSGADPLQGSSKSSISGESGLGSYALDLRKAQSIDFYHAEGSAGDEPDWRQPIGFVAIVNGRKVYSLRCLFPYLGRERGRTSSRRYPGKDAYSALPVVKDRALYFIPFSLIEKATPQKITFAKKKPLEGISYGRSGIFEGNHGRLQGNTKFGTIEGKIELSLANVKTIEFLHDEDLQIAAAHQPQDHNHGQFNSDSELRAVITPKKDGDKTNNEIEVGRLDVLTANTGRDSSSESPFLRCYLGQGHHTVTLSKLREIRAVRESREWYTAFSWKTKIMATLVPKVGSARVVELENPDIYFTGVSDLGYVVIRARDVERIQIK